MTFRMLSASAAFSLLLSGCSATPPSPQVNALHQEVSQLNQQMRTLTHQATALEIQGQLNGQLNQGAWLLPQAKTPVELETQVGKLRLSLAHVRGEPGGSRAELTIAAPENQPLPALRAQVVWGELDPASGKPLEAESVSQPLTVPAGLTPCSTVTVPLRLNGFNPQQLGYVRIHQVEPLLSASTQP